MHFRPHRQSSTWRHLRGAIREPLLRRAAGGVCGRAGLRWRALCTFAHLPQLCQQLIAVCRAQPMRSTSMHPGLCLLVLPALSRQHLHSMHALCQCANCSANVVHGHTLTIAAANCLTTEQHPKRSSG